MYFHLNEQDFRETARDGNSERNLVIFNSANDSVLPTYFIWLSLDGNTQYAHYLDEIPGQNVSLKCAGF